MAVDGVLRPVTARRQRAVLACLALRAGQAVSADRLLEDVWGDALPDTGRRAIPYQIAKLRSSLEPDRVGEGTLITTTPAGYLLDVAPDDVDALRFERLVARARELVATDPAGCEELVVEALGLWRAAPPFADLGDEPFVESECRRLEQLHMVARRTLAEARIVLGREGEVIDDLEQLIGDHPLDEALVELSMAALHRAGRTAEALRLYGAFRRRLSEELGIEPSHGLQRIEQALLADDAAPPWRALGYLGNRVDGGWVDGRADRDVEILRRLDSILAGLPHPAPYELSIRVGVAANEGRWDDVVAATDSTAGLDPFVVVSVQLRRAQALGALGRHDEARAVLDTIDHESPQYRHGLDEVRASIDLRGGEPRAAAEHLSSYRDHITQDGRRLAVGAHVAALLAVAAQDLGQHEVAAILFGYTSAEQQRLDIELRPSDRPLADRAIDACRTVLGRERFDQLFAQGEHTRWSDLPDVDISAQCT